MPRVQDLLASSFGPAEFTGDVDEGLILFWTLKNHQHPARAIRSRVGVTSMSFGSEHPQLLAAGKSYAPPLESTVLS